MRQKLIPRFDPIEYGGYLLPRLARPHKAGLGLRVGLPESQQKPHPQVWYRWLLKYP